MFSYFRIINFGGIFLELINYNEDIKKHPPIDAVINITDACNLNCDYCFNHPSPRHMSLQTGINTVKWIINNFYKLPIEERRNPSISFFGGEPMLRYEELIIPLMEWADENIQLPDNFSISWGMTTNGTLLTKENLRYLSMRKDFSILFSCDGDAEVQNTHRKTVDGKDSFDLIKENIPILLKYFPNTVFRATVTAQTVHKLFDSYIFAKQSGFKNFFVMPNCREQWKIEDVLELGYQLSNIGRQLYDDIINQRPLCDYIDLSRIMLNWVIKKQTLPFINYRTCGLGCSSVGISANGEITGCQERNSHDLNEIFYIGDIYTGINEQKHKRLLSSLITEQVARKNLTFNCDECIIRDFCSSRLCVSANYDVSNNLFISSNINCQWQIMLYEIAQALCELAAIENNENFKDWCIQYEQQPLFM